MTQLSGKKPSGKVVASAADAVARIGNGATLTVGGFGLCGIPEILIEALLEQGATDLEVISNNCGVDDWGLGILLSAGRIRRITASYVGENKDFERRYLSGDLEVELVPQGTLAERVRAGGAGIPAFYTPAGVGTLIAEGGVPLKYNADGTVEKSSPAKEVREFDGREYVMERGITADFGLVRASIGDRDGNLIFDKSTQNFNPLMAAAGRYTIAEVEQLVEPGEIDPQQVHTPGVFVQAVVPLSPEDAQRKRIERTTVSKEA